MQSNSFQPIGIFDSGVGGLVVSKALIKTLSRENIVYFGDTAHFPWGDKSVNAICDYAEKATQFLLKKNCKLILIACHTASAVAYEMLQEKYGKDVLIVNVIDPLIEYLSEEYIDKNIGLIATKLTVNSNIYGKKVIQHEAKINLFSQATPLITMAIEEGFFDHEIIEGLLNIYLTGSNLQNLDALVLACTHYPLIQEKIRTFYKNKVDVIDPSNIVAVKVKEVLEQHNLLHMGNKILQHFYVSDYTPAFAKSAHLFFGSDVQLEEVNN